MMPDHGITSFAGGASPANAPVGGAACSHEIMAQ
jgi:hypothetical protein